MLDQKLVLLAEHAEFQVNINSVLGSGVKNPEDALAVARRALELGFTSTVGRSARRQRPAQAAEPHEQEIFEQVMDLGKRSYSRFNQFQHNIARGKANEWRCRSGARYLYICEDGLVHWCSQQRGYPGIPLPQYTDGRFPPRVQHRQALRARAARSPAPSRWPCSTTGARRRR